MTLEYQAITATEEVFIERARRIINTYGITCKKASVADVIDAATEQVVGVYAKATFEGPFWRIHKAKKCLELIAAEGI